MRLIRLTLSITLFACGPDDYEEHRKRKEQEQQRLQPPPSKEENEQAGAWIKDNTPAARERLAKLAKLADAIDERPPVFEPEIATQPGVALELDPSRRPSTPGSSSTRCVYLAGKTERRR